VKDVQLHECDSSIVLQNEKREYKIADEFCILHGYLAAVTSAPYFVLNQNYFTRLRNSVPKLKEQTLLHPKDNIHQKIKKYMDKVAGLRQQISSLLEIFLFLCRADFLFLWLIFCGVMYTLALVLSPHVQSSALTMFYHAGLPLVFFPVSLFTLLLVYSLLSLMYARFKIAKICDQHNPFHPKNQKICDFSQLSLYSPGQTEAILMNEEIMQDNALSQDVAQMIARQYLPDIDDVSVPLSLYVSKKKQAVYYLILLLLAGGIGGIIGSCVGHVFSNLCVVPLNSIHDPSLKGIISGLFFGAVCIGFLMLYLNNNRSCRIWLGSIVCSTLVGALLFDLPAYVSGYTALNQKILGMRYAHVHQLQGTCMMFSISGCLFTGLAILVFAFKLLVYPSIIDKRALKTKPFLQRVKDLYQDTELESVRSGFSNI
jgi:hypothetical protein